MVDGSFQFLLIGLASGRMAEMAQDIVEYVNIYTFAPAFIISMVGFAIGLFKKSRARKSLGFFNEGMYAGLIVVIVAVLFYMYQPPAIEACALFGGSGVLVFVVSLVLRRLAIKKINNDK